MSKNTLSPKLRWIAGVEWSTVCPRITVNLFEKPDETIAEWEISGIGQRELAKKLCGRYLIIDIIGQYHAAHLLHPFWKYTFFIHWGGS